MDPVTSLKIIVFPSLEDKIFASDRKGFYPTSSSAFNTKGTLANRQIQNGDRIDLRKLAAERKISGNKRQFSCPSIIDFNTLKSYQEIRPMHKPKRIFNGFFPSRVRSTISVGLQGAYRDGQELTLEELVPNPNTPPYHDGAVLSRNATSRNSSLRSEPITFPNESESRLKTKQDSRRVVYSLRNGSPSPWVDRYKLKQKSISALTYVELKNKTSPAEEPPVRGFSR
ncbi:uncharacterized protein [Porites lutea]|uniref:uncharacterized protein n=1 Tax=Porites lutea TaxID=51062 RepID=UPI003CC59D3B